MRTLPTISYQSGFNAIIDGIVQVAVSYFGMTTMTPGCVYITAHLASEVSEAYDGRCMRVKDGIMYLDAEIY